MDLGYTRAIEAMAENLISSFTAQSILRDGKPSLYISSRNLLTIPTNYRFFPHKARLQCSQLSLNSSASSNIRGNNVVICYMKQNIHDLPMKKLA